MVREPRNSGERFPVCAVLESRNPKLLFRFSALFLFRFAAGFAELNPESYRVENSEGVVVSSESELSNASMSCSVRSEHGPVVAYCFAGTSFWSEASTSFIAFAVRGFEYR